jgi:hypothetical protein
MVNINWYFLVFPLQIGSKRKNNKFSVSRLSHQEKVKHDNRRQTHRRHKGSEVEHSALADVGGSLLKFLPRSKMKIYLHLMGEVVTAF